MQSSGYVIVLKCKICPFDTSCACLDACASILALRPLEEVLDVLIVPELPNV